jgi:hypothetical protein
MASKPKKSLPPGPTFAPVVYRAGDQKQTENFRSDTVNDGARGFRRLIENLSAFFRLLGASARGVVLGYVLVGLLPDFIRRHFPELDPVASRVSPYTTPSYRAQSLQHPIITEDYVHGSKRLSQIYKNRSRFDA